MIKEEIKPKLQAIVKSLGVKQDEIERDANLFAEAILDSMTAIDYMIQIEEEFVGISINNQIVQEKKLGKISDMTDYIYDTLNSISN